MKQFWIILKFELLYFLKNKVFVGVTVFLMLSVAAVMFFPRVRQAIRGEDARPQERGTLLLAVEEPELEEPLAQAFREAFPGYELRLTDGEPDTLRAELLSGAAEGAFVIHSLTDYTYYVDNLSLYDANTAVADEVLGSVYRFSVLVQAGLSPEQAQAVLAAPVTHETESLGKDQTRNFFYTYIMIFALYMVILLYGQMVATNVATEKSSRAMELLVTSARPNAMMFGKVIASCLAGLAQLVCVFGTSFVCFRANRGFWEDNPIMGSVFDMPPELLGYMLLFFVLGFFIYAFLYGAVGSTASKLEDINTSVMPITMLFLAGFMVVIFSMTGSSVDTPLMVACSFIPFTSPMAMFTRIAMSTVPGWQIALSVAILAASAVGVGALSAKIYRVGVLLYGTPPKLSAIIKAIRRA